MKIFDSRNKCCSIATDAKILEIELYHARIDVCEKDEISIRLKAPSLHIHYQIFLGSETKKIIVHAPHFVSKDNDCTALSFNCAQISEMFLHCSRICITDDTLSIASYLHEAAMTKIKYLESNYYGFKYSEACKKDAIKDFITDTSLVCLLESSAATNDLNVLKAFYELIFEKKGVKQ